MMAFALGNTTAEKHSVVLSAIPTRTMSSACDGIAFELQPIRSKATVVHILDRSFPARHQDPHRQHCTPSLSANKRTIWFALQGFISGSGRSGTSKSRRRSRWSERTNWGKYTEAGGRESPSTAGPQLLPL